MGCKVIGISKLSLKWLLLLFICSFEVVDEDDDDDDDADDDDEEFDDEEEPASAFDELLSDSGQARPDCVLTTTAVGSDRSPSAMNIFELEYELKPPEQVSKLLS
jgi:hypothetical protein